MSDPIKEYQKLKQSMAALRDSAIQKLKTELQAAQTTLAALNDMGAENPLHHPDISPLLKSFANGKTKTKVASGTKRFSAKKAKAILGTGQLTITELAKALELDVAQVKANLDNSKEFAVSGTSVKVK